jgi:hypothetical protein
MQVSGHKPDLTFSATYPPLPPTRPLLYKETRHYRRVTVGKLYTLFITFVCRNMAVRDVRGVTSEFQGTMGKPTERSASLHVESS